MPSMSKRLLYSVLIVLVWLGFVVEGSHALFVGSATLATNTISTGTANLLISNSQNGSSTTYADTRPGFALNLDPGDSDTHYFLLKNTGTGNVGFDITVAAMSASGLENLSMEQAINLEFTPVDSSGTATGSATTFPMIGLQTSPNQLNVTIPANSVQRFKLKTTLSSSYPNQNQTTGYDLMFVGVQHGA